MISNIKSEIKLYANIERARRSFWDYCNVKASDFYKADRAYLTELCNTMQDFATNDTDVLIINLPPRFGKSRTACNYVEWLLGQNNKIKITTGSYNETLSVVFSKQVRNTIQEQKADRYKIVYTDIFPNTQIRRGDGAMNLWGLVGSGEANYLATSPSGTATGFGAEFLLIDDLIKSAYEANNEAILAAHWSWFTDTMYSRLEGRRKVIIIMTQWALKDLAHLAEAHFKSIGQKVEVFCRNATNKDGSMLCDEILDKEAYETKRLTLAPNIFEANYNNTAVDMADALYGEFKTYTHDSLPKDLQYIVSYADTADEGNDFLCKITAQKTGKYLYFLDVYYTQDKMETTEYECAKRDKQYAVNYSIFESNNGGKLFAKNVVKEAEKLDNFKTNYSWKATTKNKETKILTAASGIINTCIMPEDWATRWPEFAVAVKTYSRTGKNLHDDAPDCMSMLYNEVFEV